MNERIKELAGQAKEYAFQEIHKPQDPTKWKSYNQMYDEKFAELIVKECSVLVSENFHECNTAVKMDSIIKHHFGITK